MAVKNAVAKTWSIAPSSDGKRWSAWPAGDKPSGATRSWTQVTGNEGYRVIWGASSQAAASGAIEAIQALYANSADTATGVNSYTISGSGTIYWRVATLINGYPQEWSDESSFSA